MGGVVPIQLSHWPNTNTNRCPNNGTTHTVFGFCHFPALACSRWDSNCGINETTTATLAGEIKGILKERLWRFRELIYYFRATQYAIWCRLENHEDLSNQSTFVLKLLSSAAVKYWLYWVSISARGCKQNLKNETKQSGLKSDYALSQTRSGALLLKLLIRWRESNRFHKLCTSSVSGLSRSVEERKTKKIWNQNGFWFDRSLMPWKIVNY